MKLKQSLYLNRLKNAYKKHGWFPVTAENNTLLVYSNSLKSKLLFIAKSIESDKIVSFSDTINTLNSLEEKYKDSLTCSSFTLFSPNGFEDKSYNVNEFNCALIDLEELEDLEGNDDRIMLLPHNQSAFKALVDKINLTGKAAAVRATGTGKSYLSAKVVEYFNDTTLFVAPSNFILDNHKEINGDKNIYYVTYAKLALMSKEEIVSMNIKLIVLDEFHRAGASTWGAGVKNLISSNPDSYVLGTSATAIRHLDDRRDMTDELGFGDPILPLPLEEAIVKGILPAPTYISALYDMNETIEKTKSILEANHSPQNEKLVSLSELSDISVNWKESQGIEDIIKKHLNKTSGKYIVFFEDQKHLSEFSPTVIDWFKKNNSVNINTFQVSSNTNSTNMSSLKQFEDADPSNSTNILFSVNMLNEGLHIKGVNGLFMLRKTGSENIYYQQLGRGFDAGVEDGAIVFDLVNNLDNISASNIKSKIDKSFDKNNDERTSLGLNTYQSKNKDYTGKIVDECFDLIEKLDAIKNKYRFSERVSDAILLIYEYKNKFGSYKGWSKNNDFLSKDISYELTWIRRQFNENKFSNTEIKLLEETGFLSFSEVNYDFDQTITPLSKFIKKENRLPIMNETDIYGNNVGSILSTIKAVYKNKETPEYKIQKIQEIVGEFISELDMNIREKMFEDNIQEITEFIALNDRLPTHKDTNSKNQNIGDILDRLKTAYMRKNNTHERREKILNSLGRFSSFVEDKPFDNMLAVIKDFIDKNNRLPLSKEVDSEGNKVGTSLNSIKYKYKNSYSESKKKKVLDMLGKFSEAIEGNHYEKAFEKSLKKLTDFIALHNRLPSQSESDEYGNKVGNTLNTIKTSYKDKNYPKDKKKKIKQSLGDFSFTLEIKDTEIAFNKSLSDLKNFINKNKRLPKTIETDQDGNKVGTTLTSIKSAFRKGSYNKDRIDFVIESFGVFKAGLPEAKIKTLEIKKDKTTTFQDKGMQI